MNFFKAIGTKIKNMWAFINNQKAHIIPFFLWISCMNSALNKDTIWYQTLGPVVAGIFYYAILLAPTYMKFLKNKYKVENK